MSDKRKKHRVPLDPTDELAMVVIKTQHGEVEGLVIDLSVGGMGVFLDTRFRTVLRDEEQVYVHMSSLLLDDPLVAPAIVRHRVETSDGRLYGLEFIDWLGLRARLPQPLAAMFNQRREYRVKPQPEDSLLATVKGTETPFRFEAIVCDISRRGLGMRIPPDETDLPGEESWAQISFSLPGESEEISFVAKIWPRGRVEGEPCFGAFFDEGQTLHFQKMQRVLIPYVARLRREELRLVD